MNSPAVFLDRDGTLIEDRGHLSDPSQAVFYSETLHALRRLQSHFLLFIVTNQNGVSRGILRTEDANRVNAHVVQRLKDEGVAIREVYCCPHIREDGCACIKPKPYFLIKAAQDHSVDLSRSFVVGDHPADVELAVNAGGRGIYVLSGHGGKHRNEIQVPCEIVDGISGAADAILCASAATVLRRGGLVAFPTETVYGLGADASNLAAVRRVFDVKGRPSTHPLIVHLAGSSDVVDWAAELPDAALRLAQEFWPGPLTIVLKRSAKVPNEVTGGLETVALRVPAHPLAQRLLREFGGGIAAPSANRFGRVSPTTAEHVLNDLGADVDFILDGGRCEVGVESTIVDFSTTRPALLRHGGIPKESIEAALMVDLPCLENGAVRCPGTHPSHYAPRARVILAQDAQILSKAKHFLAHGLRVAVMSPHPLASLPSEVIRLPFPEEIPDMARELYVTLRRADALQVNVVITALPPPAGLGVAIADRLRRAASPRRQRKSSNACGAEGENAVERKPS